MPESDSSVRCRKVCIDSVSCSEIGALLLRLAEPSTPYEMVDPDPATPKIVVPENGDFAHGV